MNIFNLLGYVSDKPYRQTSTTNAGRFALIKVVAPSTGYKLYLGATRLYAANLKFGSSVPQSVYFGSNKVLLT